MKVRNKENGSVGNACTVFVWLLDRKLEQQTDFPGVFVVLFTPSKKLPGHYFN